MKIRSKILGIYTFALLIVLSVVILTTYPLILHTQGQASLRLFVVIILLVGIVSVLISSFLLELVVVQRVSDLTMQVNHIKDYRSFYYKLKFKGGDEVAILADAINQMLDRIVTSVNEVSGLNTELQQEKADEEELVEKRTKELSTEKARLKASVSNLSLGFIMTDPNNDVALINSQAVAILSSAAKPSETSSPSVEDDTHTWTITEINERFGAEFNLQELLAKSLEDSKLVDTTDVVCSGRILRVLISPIIEADSNDKLGCVILLEDITEQKVLERSRDEFFSIASHELRTPLTAIRGNTAMIKQFYEAKVNDADFNEMVDDIHISSVRLINIVNDFLDASRLEQGKIKFKSEMFDLAEVLESVTYETDSIAKEKANQMIIDNTLKTMPPVYADKDRVKQIVYNLVGNAMKFTDKGTITITAHEEGAKLKVLVTDTGPGIPEESQKLLFRKFQQAGSDLFTRETSRGTGLGLYISKLLVEGMGGNIALENSQLGKGTTFSFTLPLAKP